MAIKISKHFVMTIPIVVIIMEGMGTMVKPFNSMASKSKYTTLEGINTHQKGTSKLNIAHMEGFRHHSISRYQLIYSRISEIPRNSKTKRSHPWMRLSKKVLTLPVALGRTRLWTIIKVRQAVTLGQLLSRAVINPQKSKYLQRKCKANHA